jgi:hypothetical protein
MCYESACFEPLQMSGFGRVAGSGLGPEPARADALAVVAAQSAKQLQLLLGLDVMRGHLYAGGAARLSC